MTRPITFEWPSRIWATIWQSPMILAWTILLRRRCSTIFVRLCRTPRFKTLPGTSHNMCLPRFCPPNPSAHYKPHRHQLQKAMAATRKPPAPAATRATKPQPPKLLWPTDHDKLAKMAKLQALQKVMREKANSSAQSTVRGTCRLFLWCGKCSQSPCRIQGAPGRRRILQTYRPSHAGRKEMATNTAAAM